MVLRGDTGYENRRVEGDVTMKTEKKYIQIYDGSYKCPHCDDIFDSFEDWGFVDKGYRNVVRRCPECEEEVYL